MKQIWITRAGPPQVLEVREASTPTPRTGEVRIQVEAAGVNFADVLGRMGIYPNAPDIPYVPGYEVAGVIDAVAQGVPDLREGDAVLAVTRFGGYTDHLCVPHKQVFKRLEWMSAEDGAALLVNYLTAYQALVVMGSLNKGERVLIHGVGGGVGLAALDISRIIGAQTFGTSSPHKHDFLRERGLDHPIDYRNDDYEEVVAELTAGEGVQLVLDPLGGRHWKKNYRLLMPTGRVVHYGISSLAPTKRRSLLDIVGGLLHLPFYSPVKLINENKGVIGLHWGRLWEQIDIQRPWVEQIVRWYDEALFRPHVDRIFKFRDAADAHDYIQDRKNVGKVLLVP